MKRTPEHLRFLSRRVIVCTGMTLPVIFFVLACVAAVYHGWTTHPLAKRVAEVPRLGGLVLVGVLFVTLLWERRRYGRRVVDARAKACVRCGYPLTDRVTRARCNECGLAMTKDDFAHCVKFVRGRTL